VNEERVDHASQESGRERTPESSHGP
jgi:hypothetical protein